jgi:hypothetical protein
MKDKLVEMICGVRYIMKWAKKSVVYICVEESIIRGKVACCRRFTPAKLVTNLLLCEERGIHTYTVEGNLLMSIEDKQNFLFWYRRCEDNLKNGRVPRQWLLLCGCCCHDFSIRKRFTGSKRGGGGGNGPISRIPQLNAMTHLTICLASPVQFKDFFKGSQALVRLQAGCLSLKLLIFIFFFSSTTAVTRPLSCEFASTTYANFGLLLLGIVTLGSG